MRLEFIIFIDHMDIIKKGSYLKLAAESRVRITCLFFIDRDNNLELQIGILMISRHNQNKTYENVNPLR